MSGKWINGATVCSCVLILLVVAPIAAEGPVAPIAAVEAQAPAQFSSGGPLTAVLYESGFEPDEGCFIGYVGGGGSGDPQNCSWHASTSAQPGFAMPEIIDVNPLDGLQHLHFEYDPNQPSGVDAGARNWAFSDNVVPAPDEGIHHLGLDLRISSFGVNQVIIQPQAPSQELLTTVMTFDPSGSIFAADDNANCEDDLFQPNNDTGNFWEAGQYVHVDICVNTCTDRIRYFYDGEMVYSTGAGEGGIGGPLGCGVFAGSIIEHVLIRFDENFQDAVDVDVDNVVIEEGNCPLPGPCPQDLDGSGAVDFGDILAILAAWGPCVDDCAQDLDQSCMVDFGDLLKVLAAWGPC